MRFFRLVTKSSWRKL